MAFEGGIGAAGMGTGIVLAVVGIIVGALLLWLTAKIFKLSDKSFKTPLTIAAIAGVVGFVLGLIPFVNLVGWLAVIILTIWLIKTKYRVDWGRAVLAWLVYFVMSLVVMFILGMLFFGGMMMGTIG
jgi:hypothetical protein